MEASQDSATTKRHLKISSSKIDCLQVRWNKGLNAESVWECESVRVCRLCFSRCRHNHEDSDNQTDTEISFIGTFNTFSPANVGHQITWLHPHKTWLAMLEIMGCNIFMLYNITIVIVKVVVICWNGVTVKCLSLIHIWRCRRIERCRSRWSPYH